MRINQVEITMSLHQIKYCNSLGYCDLLMGNKIYLNEIAHPLLRVNYLWFLFALIF